MHSNTNRAFKFTSGNFEVNNFNGNNAESNVDNKTARKDINNFRVHKPIKHETNADGTVKFDAETQKKLEAMARNAKANGGNSSGMDAEYLSKIPARQHNQITMAVAGDKVKENTKKMNEEIMKTSTDEATTDILAETANDNIIYRNYDMSDLDAYIEKIGSMTMLEAISLKNSVSRELNRLESCHTMVKAVSELRDNFDFVEPGKEPTAMDRRNAGTDVDRSVLTTNYLDQYGYNENIDEFNQLYTDYQPKLQDLIDKLNAHIDECSPKAASTKYMTNDFLHIINKRINNLSETETNYAHLSKSLVNLKNAFENRTSVEWLENKMNTFVKNKNHLKDVSRALTGTMSDVASKLNTKFADKTMHNFVFFINQLWEGNYNKTLSFLYFLNYVCANEADSNLDAWVKVMLLNVSDMTNDIWDLDEIAENDYALRVRDAFSFALAQMDMTIKNKKVKVNPVLIQQYEKILNMEFDETPEETNEAAEKETK